MFTAEFMAFLITIKQVVYSCKAGNPITLETGSLFLKLLGLLKA